MNAHPAQPPQCRGPARRRSTSEGGPVRRSARREGGFTLLELIVVISIIGLLAALTVPSLKNAQKSNALASASQQLIDDVARARRLAIKDRTTVLMVFMPRAKANDPLFQPLNTGEKNVLLRGQQTGYRLYTFRQVGDQPGDSHPRELGDWRYLPSGFFIPDWMFDPALASTTIVATNSREQAELIIKPFAWSKQKILVPTMKSPRRVPVELPYLAFGPKGGLMMEKAAGQFVPVTEDRDRDPNRNRDACIPLARGSIFLERDPNDDKKLAWAPAEISERPAGNSLDTYHLIVIDRFTGRTRVAKPEIIVP